MQRNLVNVLGLITSVSLQGPADITTLSALINLILRQLQFPCSVFAVESQLVVHPCQALKSQAESLSLLWGWTGWWWEAVGIACSICGKLFSDFSLIAWWRELAPDLMLGAVWAQSGGRDLPLTSPGLPFLFSWGEAAIPWEKTKGADISDGSKVTPARKCGHLS